MRTYDLHQHLWPEPLISALSARIELPRLRGTTLETVEGPFEIDLAAQEPSARLGLLERDGIDTAVISLAPSLGIEDEGLIDAYHDGMREIVARADGRIAALADRASLEGFVGATVAGRRIVEGLDELAPLLESLQRDGRYLFVHPGPGEPSRGRPGWWAAIVDYTTELQAAHASWLASGVDRYPELRVVFAILAGGAPFQLERLRSRGVELHASPNVFFDTASYGQRALELCLATVGEAQLVYGSDIPVIDGQETLRALSGFENAVRDAVCSKNPERILG
jgi:predicted TIM-barrel fold metal-dependent hydrolase